VLPFSTVIVTSCFPLPWFNPYSIAAFTFSLISTFKHTPPYLFWYRRRPHADGSDIYPTCCNRWGAGKNVLRKVQATLRPGTGGRLCSPNLRFWRPALSIELHPYMCAFPLKLSH